MTTRRGGMPGNFVALLIFGLAFAVLGVAACHDGGSPKHAAPVTQTAPSAHFEELPCGRLLSREIENARCGYLSVPENRSESATRTIRLAVAVLKATGDGPAADPLVYLTGGPGYSELYGDLDRWLSFAAPLRTRRDLIFFDQRGVGLSRPALNCPELTAQFLARLAEPAGSAESAARAAAALEACRDVLVRSGIDLSAYSSAAVADDIVDLMHELGYREWNLFGLSYGGRMALTAMREHPDGLRSVVLDSPVPLQVYFAADVPANFQRSLGLVFDACAAAAACDAAFPDLRRVALDLVDRLNASPVTVEVNDPASGHTRKVVVTGDGSSLERDSCSTTPASTRAFRLRRTRSPPAIRGFSPRGRKTSSSGSAGARTAWRSPSPVERTRRS